METRLKIEIGLLALLVGAFLFWQARVSFASMAHDLGTARVAQVAAVLGSMLAIVAGARVAVSHARRLRGRAPGPAWLALPIPMVPLLAHLEWEARAEALWVIPLVPAILIALAGLVPAWWIGALGLGVALSFEIASRADCGWPFAPRAPARKATTRSTRSRAAWRWTRAPCRGVGRAGRHDGGVSRAGARCGTRIS